MTPARFNLGHNHPAADAARRADVLRAALLLVSTDLAQDALEDPIGHAERRAGGFVRLAVSVADSIQATLKETQS